VGSSPGASTSPNGILTESGTGFPFLFSRRNEEEEEEEEEEMEEVVVVAVVVEEDAEKRKGKQVLLSLKMPIG
jgi:hypothetical protein